MLTVDFDRWAVRSGDSLLDLGSGSGRHSFEALRRGLHVVAVDLDIQPLTQLGALSVAMQREGQVPAGALAALAVGDARSLPFADATFDRIVAAEVFEHIDDDGRALKELARVLKPSGSVAITVPRWWPERVCWALSAEYPQSPGGHIRIYRADELASKLRAAGLFVNRMHHAHALHSPYWWLKCLFGLDNDSVLPRLYHRFLVWELVHRPRLTRVVEKALDPFLGKSLVLYADKQPGTYVAA